MDAAALDLPAHPAESAGAGLLWPNRFRRLGAEFLTEREPGPIDDPHWVATSDEWAEVPSLPGDWTPRPDWQALQRFHLAEVAIRQAYARDLAEPARRHRILRHPYDDQEERASYTAFPPDRAPGVEVSCSS
jgi:uncharacterized protein YdiU (UPF0061 family)